MSYLSENALQLRTRPIGGRPTLLKLDPNRYNRVSMSGRLGEQWLNADLTIDEWKGFCQYIGMAARSKEPVTHTISLLKSEATYGEIIIGRDDDGFVYIEINNRGKGKLRFEFLPKRQYVHLKNGAPIPENELSRNRAIAWSTLIEPMVIEAWKAGYKVEDAKPMGGFNKGGYQKPAFNNNQGGGFQQGGQQQGGGFQQGGQQGGYQKPAFNNNQQAPAAAPMIDGDLDSYLP